MALRALLDASLHLYKRVCPSVGPSVRLSVGHAFVKNKGNQYFRANQCQRRFTRLARCIIASLYDSPLIHQSVSPSVCQSIGCLSHREYQHKFQLIEVENSLISQVISSSCNHSIIMRMYRWACEPCSFSLSPFTLSFSLPLPFRNSKWPRIGITSIVVFRGPAYCLYPREQNQLFLRKRQ